MSAPHTRKLIQETIARVEAIDAELTTLAELLDRQVELETERDQLLLVIDDLVLRFTDHAPPDAEPLPPVPTKPVIDRGGV